MPQRTDRDPGADVRGRVTDDSDWVGRLCQAGAAIAERPSRNGAMNSQGHVASAWDGTFDCTNRLLLAIECGSICGCSHAWKRGCHVRRRDWPRTHQCVRGYLSVTTRDGGRSPQPTPNA